MDDYPSVREILPGQDPRHHATADFGPGSSCPDTLESRSLHRSQSFERCRPETLGLVKHGFAIFEERMTAGILDDDVIDPV